MNFSFSALCKHLETQGGEAREQHKPMHRNWAVLPWKKRGGHKFGGHFSELFSRKASASNFWLKRGVEAQAEEKSRDQMLRNSVESSEPQNKSEIPAFPTLKHCQDYMTSNLMRLMKQEQLLVKKCQSTKFWPVCGFCMESPFNSMWNCATEKTHGAKVSSWKDALSFNLI